MADSQDKKTETINAAGAGRNEEPRPVRYVMKQLTFEGIVVPQKPVKKPGRKPRIQNKEQADVYDARQEHGGRDILKAEIPLPDDRPGESGNKESIGSVGIDAARNDFESDFAAAERMGTGTFDESGAAGGDGDEGDGNAWGESAIDFGDITPGDSGDVRNFVPAVNFRIHDKEKILNAESLSKKTKIQNNMVAIRTLLQVEERGEEACATEEECTAMAMYSGWGGYTQIFDPMNTEFIEERRELMSMLSPTEYAEARATIQDSYYTPYEIIESMYAILEKAGVKGSVSVLEPGSGIGRFVGMAPDTINFNTDSDLIEQDSVSARIAGFLYPAVNVRHEKFQKFMVCEDQYDVVLGNPPYGQVRLFDPMRPEYKSFLIHSYFVAKAIDALKPGGVGIFVVSRSFMDQLSTQARDTVHSKAELLGALRLPVGAFKDSLTNVGTDIVVFKKREQPVAEKDYIWKETAVKEGMDVNNFFVANPLSVLGKWFIGVDQYGKQTTNCVRVSADPLFQQIQQRFELFPENVYDSTPPRRTPRIATATECAPEILDSRNYKALLPGSYFYNHLTKSFSIKTSETMYGEAEVAFPAKTAKQIQIRDTAMELLATEMEGASEPEIEELRQRLNHIYDEHVKDFGYLNANNNTKILKNDPKRLLLMALETNYDKGLSKKQAEGMGVPERKPSAVKATIFSKRIHFPVFEAKSADSAQDALLICLREKGRVDLAYMSKLCSIPQVEIQSELASLELIFKNPENGQWEIKDKYLSGNVKDKLKKVMVAVESMPEYQINVSALSRVIPEDILPVDICIQLGSTWVPGPIYEKFAKDILGVPFSFIVYSPEVGKWAIDCNMYGFHKYTKFGTEDCPADKIFASLMTQAPIVVEDSYIDEDGRTKKTVNQEKTLCALQKAEEMQTAFTEWIWDDDDRRESLSAIYNEQFNTNVAPSYDGSHLVFPGMTSEISLRPHQKNAVWRAIQEGTALFDHVVGSGKTITAIATIMEMRRMGMVSKPMIVVPNHLLYDWRDEFLRVYPSAKLLVADKDAFGKDQRVEFLFRTATEDWDAIIIPHSSFGKIQTPAHIRMELFQEEMDQVLDGIRAQKESGSMDYRLTRLLERRKTVLEQRQESLAHDMEKQDKELDFSQLGIGALFIDESQCFKNLGYVTSLRVSGLGNPTGSIKAFDLFCKSRYLQSKNNGRGLFFLTGTSISNTIAEIYTLQRYMQSDVLREHGILYFDAWASTFGKITSAWELDSTGVSYTRKDRFASFQNIPELIAMCHQFMDVVVKKDMDDSVSFNGYPLTPPVENGKPYAMIASRSEWQAQYMDEIIKRMEHLPADPKIDNPLKITNDARKAGLDYRLIDPSAPDWEQTKINAAAEQIFLEWEKSTSVLGTQLVFCDLSTPKKKKSSKAVTEDVVSEPFEEESEAKTVESDKDDADSVESEENYLSMDDILANIHPFSVYDDLKSKLIERGIPAQQVAFIHDAKTEEAKSRLFAKVRRGDVRVIIGSTSKMGAGTNVQDRIVALHHLDAPWRPSDIEQRNGRGIRQGNQLYLADPDNFVLRIYNYATEKTYDARMWQVIEYKAKAIEEFRSGEASGSRVIEDVQMGAANAAEMKAAASGNPYILEEVQLASKIRKYEALEKQHRREQYSMRHVVSSFEKAQTKHKETVAFVGTIKRAIVPKAKATTPDSVVFTDLTNNHTYLKKNPKEIEDFLAKKIKMSKKMEGHEVEIGLYRGLAISCYFSAGRESVLRFGLRLPTERLLSKETTILYFDRLKYYTSIDSFSLNGFFTRLDNAIESDIDSHMVLEERSWKNRLNEYENAVKFVNSPFEFEKDFVETTERYKFVLGKLQSDRGEEREEEDEDISQCLS